MRFSVIVPVFNRPGEVDELLKSLSSIENGDFEIIIIEDGSDIRCNEIVDRYAGSLPVHYHYKENTGQGFSRNWAADKAKGDYLVFFDSDCLVPRDYFEKVSAVLDSREIDAWGGPDKAHPDFTILQKTIGYTMSSVFTTGGIRGRKLHAGKFQPRTFNMGVRKDVFMQLNGFKQTNLGEDIELSTRLVSSGYHSELIPEAFVYHKRRDTLFKFYKQVFGFGRGRVINSRRDLGSLKLVHLFPLFFSFGLLSFIPLYFLSEAVFLLMAGIYTVYFCLVFAGSLIEYRSLLVAILAIPVSVIQLFGYGMGMLRETFRKKGSGSSA